MKNLTLPQVIEALEQGKTVQHGTVKIAWIGDNQYAMEDSNYPARTNIYSIKQIEAYFVGLKEGWFIVSDLVEPTDKTHEALTGIQKIIDSRPSQREPLGITKGEWIEDYGSVFIRCEGVPLIHFLGGEYKAHATLVLDAVKAYQQCSMLPSELLAENEKLKLMISEMQKSPAITMSSAMNVYQKENAELLKQLDCYREEETHLQARLIDTRKQRDELLDMLTQNVILLRTNNYTERFMIKSQELINKIKSIKQS